MDIIAYDRASTRIAVVETSHATVSARAISSPHIVAMDDAMVALDIRDLTAPARLEATGRAQIKNEKELPRKA